MDFRGKRGKPVLQPPKLPRLLLARRVRPKVRRTLPPRKEVALRRLVPPQIY